MTETSTHTLGNGATKRLERSRSDRKLAGVCGGLARYFDIHAAVYRVAFVVLTLLGGAGIIIYLTAALVMPPAETYSRPPLPIVLALAAPPETTISYPAEPISALTAEPLSIRTMPLEIETPLTVTPAAMTAVPPLSTESPLTAPPA